MTWLSDSLAGSPQAPFLIAAGPALRQAAAVVVLLAVPAALFAALRRWLSLPARVRLRLHPGPGFAAWPFELRRTHGLAPARRSARRTRPGLGARQRWLGSWREYATFLGWAHGWVAPMRVYAGFEALHLVIAAPQRGKSAAAAGLIIDAPGPVVATSIRGDLIAAAGGLRQQVGRVDVFNPEGAGPYRSTLQWDPVDGCQDMAAAARRAGYMVEAMTARGLEDSTFWGDQASMTLAALMHAAALASLGMQDVYEWILGDSSNPLLILQRHPAAAVAAGRHVEHYLTLPDRTRSGVSTTLLAALKFMQVPEVAAACCPLPGRGFDIGAFLAGQDTLFLVASDGAHSPVPPLFSALVAEITHRARLAGGAAGPGRLDPPLTLALDEVANIAPVPVAAWATWAAGSGIRMHVYAQSYAQLAGRWGELGAETIWQACDVKVVYAATSEDGLCRRIQEASGLVEVRSQLADRRDSAGTQRRPVVPYAAIRELPTGTAVVIRGGARPVIVRTERYWRRADVRRFAGAGGRPALPVASQRAPVPRPAERPELPPGALQWPPRAAALLPPQTGARSVLPSTGPPAPLSSGHRQATSSSQQIPPPAARSWT